MILATILPRGCLEPVPVARAPDGTWIELAGLIGRDAPRLRDALPWLMSHHRPSPERIAGWKGPRYRESEFAFLPPVVWPPAFRDFYGFEAHLKVTRARQGLGMPAAWYEAPIFYFANPTGLCGQDAAIHAPAGSTELDYELELGVIIGHGGRDIPPERAWAHVFGFTIVNDLSARDLQRREMDVGLGSAKGKDFATAVGPWLVARQDCEDRIAGETLTLALSARVNGRELSRGNSAALHHTIPRMIAHASRDVELFPGDLIGTGPIGDGSLLALGPEKNGGWLKPGDVVELAIERIGVLRTRIAAR
ncbi:MAG: fumarylacetoacetate hydrolase family protein [Opitutaceae bacterium]|nr:fumarylacetoacetate hydrolase family protein [Opitutaceae bacterium]